MLLSMLWIFAKEHLAMRLGPNPTTDVRKLHKQSWTPRAVAGPGNRQGRG